MTNLCRKLKNYYRKEKNKIVFNNGMTLNQLALEMWEKLNYQGIDASALSRVIAGKRLFNYQQLQVFCELLNIEEKEKIKLEKALTQDFLKRHDIEKVYPPNRRIYPQFISRRMLKKEQEITTVEQPKPFFSKFVYLILIWYGVVLLWWMKLQFQPRGIPEVNWWGVFTNFVPLIGGIYGLRLAFTKRKTFEKNFFRGIIFFSLGLLSAWIGMETWVFYNIFLKVDVPYPSWADLGFLAVIPFYILGTVYFARAVGVKLNWTLIKTRLSLLLIPFALLSFCYFLFLKNIAVDFSKPLKTFLDFAYPLGDIIPITIVLVMLGMIKDVSGRTKERILYLIIALTVQFLADYSFLYYVGKGIYYNGYFIDLIFTTAYLAMGLVLYTFKDYNVNYAYSIKKVIHLVADKKSYFLLLNKLRLNFPSKILTGFYFLLFIFWFFLQQSGFKNSFWNYLYSFTFGLMPLFGGAVGILIAKSWGFFKTAIGRAIFYISLGLISWGSGNMIWVFYYNAFLNVAVPYPSLADLGYILSIPFWLIGMINLAKASRAKFDLKNIKNKSFLIMVPILVAVFSYYFLVVVAHQGKLIDSSGGYLKLFFDLVYPLGDVLILTTVLLIFKTSYRSFDLKYNSSILNILCGFVVMYLADFAFSYTTTVGAYYNGAFADLLFTTALFLMTRGLLGFNRNLSLVKINVGYYLGLIRRCLRKILSVFSNVRSEVNLPKNAVLKTKNKTYPPNFNV